MRPLFKGLLIAALHLALVASLGAKLLFDRALRPRVWVRATAHAPNLPIRGRYVRLQLEIEKQMVADENPSRGAFHLLPTPGGSYAVTETRPTVAYFVPEGVPDPSIRPQGEELWVEVTLPRKGPPRPIRLAVKRGDTLSLLPLD